MSRARVEVRTAVAPGPVALGPGTYAQVALTADGKRVAIVTESGSGSVAAGSTGTIRVTLGNYGFSKKLAALGVTGVSVSGGTAYLVGVSATTDYVDVTVYNPGTAAVTLTVTVTVALLGV